MRGHLNVRRRCGAVRRVGTGRSSLSVVTDVHGTTGSIRRARTWDLGTGGARRASRYRAVGLSVVTGAHGTSWSIRQAVLGTSRWRCEETRRGGRKCERCGLDGMESSAIQGPCGGRRSNGSAAQCEELWPLHPIGSPQIKMFRNNKLSIVAGMAGWLVWNSQSRLEGWRDGDGVRLESVRDEACVSRGR